MSLSFSSEVNRDTVFKVVEKFLLKNKFRLAAKDLSRPWGGFFVIDELQSEKFITNFSLACNENNLASDNKISPKILIVAPGKRLSWQFHNRRAELWKVIGGEVGIATSETDEEKDMKTYSPGSIIKLTRGERHRLIGLSTWGIVAEIWQHTDNENPSNEEDIVRLQDDFGR